jgi:membrane-bound lytic murein transglycosylase D
VPPQDLWQRIRQGFGMADIDNAAGARQMTYYAARPEYLQRMFDRSRMYLFHIVEELGKRGMPTELALLPMVESAFNPMAYSRAHASGLWQFIPAPASASSCSRTGVRRPARHRRLDQTPRLTTCNTSTRCTATGTRRSPPITGARTRWRGPIAKNKAAGKPFDYAHLTMPLETRHYVPEAAGAEEHHQQPEPLGIVLDPIPNQPYFATYDQGGRHRRAARRQARRDAGRRIHRRSTRLQQPADPRLGHAAHRAAAGQGRRLPRKPGKLDEKSLVSWADLLSRRRAIRSSRSPRSTA